jgi:DNA repair protein SbcC/Rad50
VLTRIRIQHYRSIECATFELHEGVNVITGSTDAGKSNVVRALRDAIYGCRGTAHVMHGSSSASVTLDTSDDAPSIVWEKGKGKERLTVDGPASREDTGRLLRMHVVPVDTNRTACLSLAQQHDGPFLLSESPATTAKILGSMTGMHIVRAAQRAVDNDARTAQRIADERSLRHDEATSAANDARETVDTLSRRLDAAEAALRDARAVDERIAALEQLYRSMASGLSDSTMWHDRVEHLSKQAAVDVDFDAMEACATRIDALQYIRDAMAGHDLRVWRSAAEECTVELERIEAEIASIDVCPLCGAETGSLVA